MRKISLIVILALSLVQFADAQRWKLKRYKIIAGVGGTQYFGDIGGAATEKNWWGLKDITIKNVRPNFHFGLLYKIQEPLDISFNANYGYFYGNDAGSQNEGRKLNFNAQFIESSFQVKYTYFSFGGRQSGGRVYNKRGMMNDFNKKYLYIYGGAGVLYSNVTSIGDISTIQRRLSSGINEFEQTSIITPVIPFGLGIEMSLTSEWQIGLDLGARYAFSDYIDGFKSRFSNANDLYYLGTVNVIYRITTSRKGLPVFYRKY